MQMIAAAKVAKSASRLQESMPYTSAISEMLVSVSEGSSDVLHPLLVEHENKKTALVIVVVSDKGLAGGFNSNILREVQHIINKYTEMPTAMQGLGYKEVVEFIENKVTKEEMIEKIKKETRHYAKRQLTWFRKNKETIWLDGEKAKEENIQIMMS